MQSKPHARKQSLHGDANVGQLADALRGVQPVLHQLPDGGVQALARLHDMRTEAVLRWVLAVKRLQLESQQSRKHTQGQNKALTLSNPAMFLFSAKNSAGLFCCRTSFLPAPFWAPISAGTNLPRPDAPTCFPLKRRDQHVHKSNE